MGTSVFSTHSSISNTIQPGFHRHYRSTQAENSMFPSAKSSEIVFDSFESKISKKKISENIWRWVLGVVNVGTGSGFQTGEAFQYCSCWELLISVLTVKKVLQISWGKVFWPTSSKSITLFQAAIRSNITTCMTLSLPEQSQQALNLSMAPVYKFPLTQPTPQNEVLKLIRLVFLMLSCLLFLFENEMTLQPCS